MAHSAPGTESATLLSSLNAQREHVLDNLEGLDEDALRRPVLPSGWTCLGLIQHLALDVERFWFRCVVAGEETAIAGLAKIPNAWHVAAEVAAPTVVAGYRQEIARECHHHRHAAGGRANLVAG